MTQEEKIHNYLTLGSPKMIETTTGGFPKADFTNWVKNRVEVFGISFETTSDVYVQLSGLETNAVLDEVQKVVSTIPETFLRAGTFDIAPGKPCLALYSEDNIWYRGRVLENINDTVKVFFVDYGNTEILDKTSITLCAKELTKFVEGISLCALYGFSGDEPEEELAIVKRMIEGQDLTARIESVDFEINGKHRILLTVFVQTDGGPSMPLKLFVQAELEKNRKSEDVVVVPEVKVSSSHDDTTPITPKKEEEKITVTEELAQNFKEQLKTNTDEVDSIFQDSNRETEAAAYLEAKLSDEAKLRQKCEEEQIALKEQMTRKSEELSKNSDELKAKWEQVGNIFEDSHREKEASYSELEAQLRQKYEEELLAFKEQETRKFEEQLQNQNDAWMAKFEKVNCMYEQLNREKDEEINKLKAKLSEETELRQKNDEEQIAVQEQMTQNFEEQLKNNDDSWKTKFEKVDSIFEDSTREKDLAYSQLQTKYSDEVELRQKCEEHYDALVRQHEEYIKQIEGKEKELPISVIDNFTCTENLPSSSAPNSIGALDYEFMLDEKNKAIVQLTRSLQSIMDSNQKECDVLRQLLRVKDAKLCAEPE